MRVNPYQEAVASGSPVMRLRRITCRLEISYQLPQRLGPDGFSPTGWRHQQRWRQRQRSAARHLPGCVLPPAMGSQWLVLRPNAQHYPAMAAALIPAAWIYHQWHWSGA